MNPYQLMAVSNLKHNENSNAGVTGPHNASKTQSSVSVFISVGALRTVRVVESGWKGMGSLLRN